MRISLMTALLAFATAVTAWAQQPLDLTGTWVATKDLPVGVGQAPSAVFGERFALRHEDGQLVLLRPVRGRTTAMMTMLPMDGREIIVANPGRTCFGESAQVLSTVWLKDALRYTIVGSVPPGGRTPSPVNLPYTFRKLSPDSLLVQSTMRNPSGPEPLAVGTVYQRSTDTLTADPPAPPPVAPATIAQIAWLTGDWLGGTGPNSVEERWSPGNGGAMIASSRTVRNDVMTEFEFLCIAERGGTLVYTAMPNGGTKTDFTLTGIDATSATFENPDHNFPTKIRYALRPDGSLEAVVSGTGNAKPITFVFKRKS
jgi:hypothetical protein